MFTYLHKETLINKAIKIMKTINHLLLIALVIFSSSCSYEDLIKSDDDSKEEPAAFLELDLHQIALEFEEKKMFRELQKIQEALAEDTENEDLVRKEKQLKNSLENNAFIYKNNEELLKGIRGPRGPRPPGKPCSGEDPDEFNCPIRMPKNQKIWFHKEQGKLLGVEVSTVNDEVCSKMAGLESVEFDDVRFQEAVMEGDQGCGGMMTITKRDSNGGLTTYSFPIER